ncbi:hypothetical protein ACS0TY_017858 [Phlomoides rotata]
MRGHLELSRRSYDLSSIRWHIHAKSAKFKLNIKCKGDEFQADAAAVYRGSERDYRSSFFEREPTTINQENLAENSAKVMERSLSRSRSRSRRGRGYLDHHQILNIQNHSIFVSTWNVVGKSPQRNMNLDD